MKKILGISLVAVLSVTPLMANADPIVTPGTMGTQPANHDAAATAGVIAAGQPYFSLIEANSLTDGNAASAGYVKGAYNAAIKAVNTVHEEAAAAQAAAEAAALTEGAGIDISNQVISIEDGGVSHAKLAADAVEAANIKNGEVTHEKLAADAVEAANIKNGEVTHAKLAADAVEAANIKNGEVTAAKLANEAVTLSKIESDDMQQGTGDYASSTKLTSKGYVDQSIAGKATKEGVTHTISNSTITVTDGKTVTTTLSGKDSVTASTTVTVPIMTDWSNPNTVSGTPLEANASTTVNASSLAVSSSLGGSITAKITGGTYTETAPANN